jgi:hypothetical protein
MGTYNGSEDGRGARVACAPTPLILILTFQCSQPLHANDGRLFYYKQQLFPRFYKLTIKNNY